MSILEISHLEKRYNKKVVLEDISIKIESGKIVGLIGENGSGKTTLLKIIAGLITPTKGEIYICSKKLSLETKKYVSFLPDTNMFYPWMKVKDAILFYEDFFEDFNKEKVIELCDSLGIKDNNKISNMSRGMIERFSIALIFSRICSLYLLDEPLAFVDAVSREKIIETILKNCNQNATIVISTNIISEIEQVFDEVIMIDKGKILFHEQADKIREDKKKSINQVFKEVIQ